MLLLLMMMMMTCVCVRERERLWLETRSSGLEFYDNVVDDVCVRFKFRFWLIGIQYLIPGL